MKRLAACALAIVLAVSCSGCFWLGLGFLGGWAVNRYGTVAPQPLPPVPGYDWHSDPLNQTSGDAGDFLNGKPTGDPISDLKPSLSALSRPISYQQEETK